MRDPHHRRRGAELAPGGALRPVKTFVDTNVLVYAHDTDAGDRHATAKALLAQLWDGRSGSLSTQVLQEFYAVVTGKFKPAMPRGEGAGHSSGLRRMVRRSHRTGAHRLREQT
jgi:predicted nucleic acid-binding protein